jgi:hypothetical protein
MSIHEYSKQFRAVPVFYKRNVHGKIRVGTAIALHQLQKFGLWLMGAILLIKDDEEI